MEGGSGSAGPALLREMGHRGARWFQPGAGLDRLGPALPTPRGPRGRLHCPPILAAGRQARQAQPLHHISTSSCWAVQPGLPSPATPTLPLGAGGSGKAVLLGETGKKTTGALGSRLTPTLDGTPARAWQAPVGEPASPSTLSKPAEGWGQRQAGDSAKGTSLKPRSAVPGGGGQGLCTQSWTWCQAGRGDISHHSTAESWRPAA